jgi:predicted AAA+ superfamily ATPase
LANLLVYVTSNRRHLINRPDGSQQEFRPEETVEEQVALAERFGLWLGFHPLDQAVWLSIVAGYCQALDLEPGDPELERSALQWSAQRGARSGRSAWHFIIERAGQLGRAVAFDG